MAVVGAGPLTRAPRRWPGARSCRPGGRRNNPATSYVHTSLSATTSIPTRSQTDADRGGDVERGPAVDGTRLHLGAEVRDDTREVVLAELVVPGVDARTEPGADGAVSDLAQARDCVLDHAVGQPAVAGVNGADRVVAGQRERRAIGGENREREPRHVRDGGVGDGGRGRRRRWPRERRRRAPGAATPTGRVDEPRRRRDAAPVLRDGSRVVSDEIAEVGRVVRRRGHATVPIGADDPCGSDARLDHGPDRAAPVSGGTRGRRTRRRRGSALRRRRSGLRRRARAPSPAAGRGRRARSRPRSGRSPPR